MSKITFEPVVEELEIIDIDVSDLYNAIWIDVVICLMLLIGLYKIIQKLK